MVDVWIKKGNSLTILMAIKTKNNVFSPSDSHQN